MYGGEPTPCPSSRRCWTRFNEAPAGRREDARGGGQESFALGALLPDLLSKLRDLRGEPRSAAVTITRGRAAHALRPAKRDRG